MASAAPQQASASPLPAWIADKNYQPPPGTLGNLTMTQLHCLDKLKKELKEEGKFVEERMDDPTLLRFCRARKFDYPAVKTMLLDFEQWRKDFGVDELTKNFDFKEKEEVNKYYPQYYHKTDKDGRPIYIEQLGKLDINALYKITTPERQIQRLVYEYEKSLSTRVKVCSYTAKHPVETFCTILDLGGVSLASFARVRDFVSQAASIGQNRYPETMGKFYIINAPWAFTMVWAVIKPWLDPVTVAKIQILGSSYRDELLKQIPIENLPKEFGGLCDCPGGCSLSDAGPWNDQNVDDVLAAFEKLVNGQTEEKEGEEKKEGEAPAAAAA
ncbi:SEC14 cytosolic factor [Coprinopsis cinerea okayama7|uniref:SEC14 cytosolic factor n=1 Tax=Coprinopsis cinerea (strain Okayama-7 / 130 / ATCC MYA-4618 / FGSC 9003) TaxID=240176 RepID=A8PGG7_COPC7|nr:SEC14 cytosolic factor [Coprinopsis cinerea okayama7\|eukprot:XP_001841214.1 SEC14 cytosolic factor [Coprinopsis cinerea okayama7\